MPKTSAITASPSPAPAPTKPDIRMVAIDLDGTLLDSDKQVSPRTAEALRGLPARGVQVVIASARPPRSVRPIYQQLGLAGWQINYNGALIWDEAAKQAVFHRPMAGRLVLEMIEFARDLFEEVLVSCEAMDKWYTDRDDHTHTTETGKLFKPDLVAPCDQWCRTHITKLMFLGEPPVMLRLENELANRYGEKVTVLHTDRDLIQIMDKRVSKGIAVKMLARHHGLSMKQVLAIGDAPNDVGMLQLAGVAVAMDNAHPLCKDVADWIAPSNDDHGVHAALVRYGLAEAV
jgi:Cof subfamily protein (haloacid dehalogenase superfamily)